eukprot:jgi/Ulvmu1/8379/UM042_0086.1
MIAEGRISVSLRAMQLRQGMRICHGQANCRLVASARRTVCTAVRQESPNKVGVHALVFSGDWTEVSCRKAINGASQAGYSLIEIPMLDPQTVDTAMTAQVLSEAGITASTSLGLAEDADINSEDAEVVQRGQALLDLALVKSHAMGASHMVGVIYSALRKYPGPCSPAARANVVSSLQALADKAADLGVTLGLEAVNRYETNVINTAAGTMELLADINRDNVVVHLDTYHMNIEEFSMEAAIRTCGDKLGYVHIGESHRGYLGTGSVDFLGLFRVLDDVGYTGPITFESFSSAVVSKDLSNTLCVWRNLWDDSDHLATHAREYIRSQQISAACGRIYHR